MRRRLLNLLTAVSLLLCVAVCALWVRSYWGSDSIWFEKVRPPLEYPGVQVFGMGTVHGCVQVEGGRWVYGPQNYPPHWWAEVGKGWTVRGGWSRNGVNNFQAAVSAMASRPVMGFRWWDQSYDQGLPGLKLPVRVYGAVVPLWAVALPTLALPAVRLAHGLRKRRLRIRLARNQCPRCGYDLRATPDKCPECGNGR